MNRQTHCTRRTTVLTAVFLVLSLSTVVLSIATKDARDAATGVGTFELTWQAHMNVWSKTKRNSRLGGCGVLNLSLTNTAGVCVCTAIGLVGVVLAVVVSITDVGRVGADSCATLELARSALEVSCSDRTQHVMSHNKHNRLLRVTTYCGQHSRQSAGSSERSPQSSSVSHFHQKGMHLSFLQTN